jgi:UDP-N-acetyl-2-amino-2-deoxyglucuronate dehydrogenase
VASSVFRKIGSVATLAKNFAIVGVAGFVAPRHLKAIKDTGNRLVAAADPHDCVGVIDRYAPEARYFPEIERFDRHLEKLRRGPSENRVDYISVCSPNYLHDAHVRLALRVGAHAICEKPLVINPWNLDALEMIEEETGRRINTVLQLRLHPSLLALKDTIEANPAGDQHDVRLTYITGRGNWYHASWKGNEGRSGGLAANIGIHFFDVLAWIFGKPQSSKVFLRDPHRMAGFLELEKARVQWFLSVNASDVPNRSDDSVSTHRSMTVDDQEVEFSSGFTDLHTTLYEHTLSGNGFGIQDARPSIELAYELRNVKLSPADENVHPLATNHIG